MRKCFTEAILRDKRNAKGIKQRQGQQNLTATHLQIARRSGFAF